MATNDTQDEDKKDQGVVQPGKKLGNPTVIGTRKQPEKPRPVDQA
jgi:hypothetical protein